MTQPAPPPASQQLALQTSVVLASATTAAAASAALWPLFSAAGIYQQAMTKAVDIVLGVPLDRFGVIGSASISMIRLNLLRNAQFLVSCAQRITADLIDAQSRGLDVNAVFQKSVSRETRYFGMHMTAGWNRAKAAAMVDMTALTHGRLLGWNTVRDKHTSRDCLAADGKNFYAEAMPLIGYPGSVHPNCRCFPGRAHEGAAILPSTMMVRKSVRAA
jgi:hypothetical protein